MQQNRRKTFEFSPTRTGFELRTHLNNVARMNDSFLALEESKDQMPLSRIRVKGVTRIFWVVIGKFGPVQSREVLADLVFFYSYFVSCRSSFRFKNTSVSKVNKNRFILSVFLLWRILLELLLTTIVNNCLQYVCDKIANLITVFQHVSEHLKTIRKALVV